MHGERTAISSLLLVTRRCPDLLGHTHESFRRALQHAQNKYGEKGSQWLNMFKGETVKG